MNLTRMSSGLPAEPMTTKPFTVGGMGIRFLGLSLALCLPAGFGCQAKLEGYAPQLTSELRRDPIVLQIPPVAPTKADLPRDGKVNEFLLALPKSGGQILDLQSLGEPLKAQLRELLGERFGTPSAPRNPTVE